MRFDPTDKRKLRFHTYADGGYDGFRGVGLSVMLSNPLDEGINIHQTVTPDEARAYAEEILKIVKIVEDDFLPSITPGRI